MNNIIKIFLLLIINLLLINLTVFTTNASMIEKSSKTRLNKVIKKVSIKDDDKRKNFLILLVNLKSKYKDSSDIEGMINYLENNVCAKSTYTQTKINTAINDIISKFKNEGYEKIKTEIIAGIKLLEANPYNAIGVRCQVSLYDNINGNKIFGEYERGYLVEADIDNYITNNYSENVDNTDNITDNDSTDSDNSTNDNTSNTQVCDEKTKKEINEKYPSIYKNINFKEYFNASFLKKTGNIYPDIPWAKAYETNNSNIRLFKVFFPKGAKSVNMFIYFEGWSSCNEGVTIKYWINQKEKPLEKGTRINELWENKYLEKTTTMPDPGLAVYSKNLQPSDQAVWVYFEINNPAVCPSYNIIKNSYTLDLDKYSDWYNNEAKWEANGDPAYDCGNTVKINSQERNNETRTDSSVLSSTITDEACKAAKKYDCHSDNGGDAFLTVNGSWCLNGKAFNSVEEANKVGMYCAGDKSLKGLCDPNKKDATWICIGGGYVSNGVSGQNARCNGTKYYPTPEKARAEGINCNDAKKLSYCPPATASSQGMPQNQANDYYLEMIGNQFGKDSQTYKAFEDLKNKNPATFVSQVAGFTMAGSPAYENWNEGMKNTIKQEGVGSDFTLDDIKSRFGEEAYNKATNYIAQNGRKAFDTGVGMFYIAQYGEKGINTNNTPTTPENPEPTEGKPKKPIIPLEDRQ